MPAWALILVGCAQTAPPPSAPPPIPPGAARLWVYRTYEPSVSRNFATVAVDGVGIGSLPPFGPAVYRDVPPGEHRLAVRNTGAESDQAQELEPAAGQEIFAKIVASESWLSGGSGQGVRREAFVIWLVSPELAHADLAQQR